MTVVLDGLVLLYLCMYGEWFGGEKKKEKKGSLRKRALGDY
jgi:hypothetical protein